MRRPIHRFKLLAPILAVPAVLLAAAPEAHAATFTVDDATDAADAVPGDGLCTTLGGGGCTLRAAVMESNAWAGADDIDILAGVGPFELNQVALGDLHLTDDVDISGNGNTIDGLGALRIFHVWIGVSVDISDITLRNGAGPLVGGAIYNQGDLVLTSSTLTNNTTTTHGGAIKSIAPGSLVLDKCVVDNNTAVIGGGIYSSGSLKIIESEINLNSASFGGGVYLSSTSPTLASITDTVISSNHADDRGGGVFNDAALNISTSRFEENTAVNSGGGLYAYISGTTDVFKSDFVGNAADEGGGAFNLWGQLALRRVNVEANHADSSGGGINNQGQMRLFRSTVFDNDAITGAGVYNHWFNADLDVRNSTISGNVADTTGGGLLLGQNSLATFNNTTVYDNTAAVGAGLWASALSTSTLTNTIVATNLDYIGVANDCVGTIVSDGYNLMQDVTSCTIGGLATADIYATEIVLDPLAMNGGRTPTHAVPAGTPVLDAGDPTTCLNKDQRGAPRPAGAGDCDIGAYELQ